MKVFIGSSLFYCWTTHKETKRIINYFYCQFMSIQNSMSRKHDAAYEHNITCIDVEAP